ncbi:MAG: hypothetical protein DRG33_02675 [Deltaproteobacteria bacterium]|nr:MAG: hypothetical protein DRG33_02675 [Deltaproteobacteria bacterium]
MVGYNSVCVNEYPLICSTIRSIGEELGNDVDFEVIAVDNWCKEVADQGQKPDRGHTMVESMAKTIPWLRVLKYESKLSHWQAKNLAVQDSNSPFLFFCDAHVLPARDAIYEMFQYYKACFDELDGTIHLPLTYHLLEEKRLIYSLRYRPEKGEVHYTFAAARTSMPMKCYEVPCMSSCGMLMTRELYDLVGGWPKELGIYGGGENFINFVLSVLGKRKWIFGSRPLYHHGEKRGYKWNFWDYERNRIIATYLFGGVEFATRFVEYREKMPGGNKKWRILDDVLDTCKEHRALIKRRQVLTIDEWAKRWI